MRNVQNLTTALFRPYFDLSDAAPGVPYHVKGVEFGTKAVLEDRPYPRIQSALNPSFRGLLCAASSQPAYDTENPLDIDPSIRSPRWGAMCEMVRHFADLPIRQQVRLSWLLGKLCFQQFLLTLIAPLDAITVASSPDAASLGYLRALARYRLWLDGEPAYQDYTIDEFRVIAENAPPGIAKIDAHYHMAAQSVKHANAADAVEFWQIRHMNAIEATKPELDDVTANIVMSRYYRVAGFLPQMRRDKAGVVRDMQLAEDFAMAVPRTDAISAAAADEILYPVLESRTKEALWMGDIDSADERTVRLLALSPCDPRAWLHRAQVLMAREDLEGALGAYRNSARYAPPGGEVALFMAGQCLEALDEPQLACDSYLAALSIDPLGISAVERIVALAPSLGSDPIEKWSRQRLAELERLRLSAAPKKAEPYKSLPAPV